MCIHEDESKGQARFMSSKHDYRDVAKKRVSMRQHCIDRTWFVFRETHGVHR
jgi:hypothetical protein